MIAALIPVLLGYQGAVQIRFAPPIGKTYRYQMTMKSAMEMPKDMPGAQAGPMGMDMKSNMELHIVSRSASGTVVHTHIGGLSMTGPMTKYMPKANLDKASKPQDGTTTIDPHFKISGATGAGASLSSAFGNMSFPDRPLHVGDTWTENIDFGKVAGAMGGMMSGAGGSSKLPMKYRLVSIGNVGRERVARLEISSDTDMKIAPMGTPMAMHIVMRGTTSLDVATGMYRDTHVNMDMTMNFSGHTMKQHMVESMSRI